jgi:uncharacterized NAD-dependent epimerase/dehydratase family protein
VSRCRADGRFDLVAQEDPAAADLVAREDAAAGVVECCRYRQAEEVGDLVGVEDVVAGKAGATGSRRAERFK